MCVVRHKGTLFSHFLSTLHQKRNTIIVVEEIVEFGSNRCAEMLEVINPVIEWRVVSLNSKDVLAIALAPSTCFEHGKSVSVEMDPATLVREDETHSTSEHPSSTVPHS